ncbi:MAG: sulfotransferase [Steroidobacteraceae bacterium]
MRSKLPAPAATEPRERMMRDALQLDQAGQVIEATAAYERLLAQWPALPDCWYNLGILQRKLLRFDAALASYGQALAFGVQRPEEVHLNRAVIYTDYLHREADAERELELALTKNPNFIPALLNLANLNEDLGRRSRALALYERILESDPNCFEALARSARLQTVVRADDPLLARLRGVLANPAVGVADKASVGFALGKALDECAAYPAAFDAYVAANRYSRASARPGSASYDRVAEAQFFDRLIASFDGTHRALDRPSDSRRPIFICGMFRSGSTLAERVLSGHPRVRAGGELDFLPRAASSILAPFPEAVGRATPAELGALARGYLELLARLFPEAQHVTDKRPDNFLYIGLIKTLFPRARIVHTVRHPLDNCLSVFFLHLDQRMSYALDLEDTGYHYRAYRRLMAHWKSLYAEDILDFDYDRFVREPRPAVERLLQFCELDWDDRCLEIDRPEGAVKTASVWQVRQPLYQRSCGRWRNYREQLGPLRAVLGDLCPSDP